MIAILLSKENAGLIANATTDSKYPLSKKQIEEKVDIPDLVNPSEPVYFIPVYTPRNKSWTVGGWATIPENAFLEVYIADMNKITTQFVEIAYK